MQVCEQTENYSYSSNAVVFHGYDDDSLETLPAMFDKAENMKLLCIPAPADQIEATFQRICKVFDQINAGGGLVQNRRGEYLLIFRNGLWDLPKGKQEAGEDILATATREVTEECGISPLETGNLLCVTHHTYHLNGRFIIKHTYWYRMKYRMDGTPSPQQEENISRCEWVKPEDLKQYMDNTYPSIKAVFQAAGLL